MQHTTKYQLNLIETSDPFSPAPLNENTQKTEAALEAKADAADHAALDQRVQVLELRKFAVGYYTGNGTVDSTSQIVQIGFTPAVVIMSQGVYLAECPASTFEAVPGGFKVSMEVYAGTARGLNTSGARYNYFAFA